VTLGAYLKSEREARGISLEKIARETRIGIRMLESIENDRLDLLPEGMFRNAFIKTYARQIQLDGDKVLQDFHLAASPIPVIINQENKRGFSLEKKSRTGTVVGAALGALIIIGLIAYLILRQDYGKKTAGPRHEGPRAGSASPAIVPPAATAPTAPPPSASQGGTAIESGFQAGNNAGGQPGSPAAVGSLQSQLKVLGELAPKTEAPSVSTAGSGVPVSPGGFDLHLTIKEKTWVSVMSGESTIFSGLLEAGNSKNFSLNHPLTITLGNAGGALISVHGQNFRPLGAPGEVRVILVTAENYQQYLASPQP
jgi:cytoskeletal protein RodZ